MSFCLRNFTYRVLLRRVFPRSFCFFTETSIPYRRETEWHCKNKFLFLEQDGEVYYGSNTLLVVVSMMNEDNRATREDDTRQYGTLRRSIFERLR